MMSAERNIDHGDNSRGTCNITGLVGGGDAASGDTGEVPAAEGAATADCVAGIACDWTGAAGGGAACTTG
jgi:hypothetical protein